MKFGKDININAPHYNSSNVRGIPCNSQSASPWMSYHCSPNTLNTRLRRYVSQLGSSTQFWGLIWTGRFVVARPLKGSSTTTCTTNKVAPSLKRFKRIMLPWHLVAWTIPQRHLLQASLALDEKSLNFGVFWCHFHYKLNLSSIHFDFEISNWIINHNRNMSTQSSCSRVPEICCSGREQPPTKCEEKSPASRPMKWLNCFCWLCKCIWKPPILFCFPLLILNETPDSHLSSSTNNLIPVKKIVASRLRALIAAPSSPAEFWPRLDVEAVQRSNQHSQGAACGGHGSWAAKSQRTPPAAFRQVSVRHLGVQTNGNLPQINPIGTNSGVELLKILAAQMVIGI